MATDVIKSNIPDLANPEIPTEDQCVTNLDKGTELLEEKSIDDCGMICLEHYPGVKIVIFHFHILLL